MVISVVQSSSGSPAFWMLHSEHMGTGLCVRGQVLLLQLGAVGWVLWVGCCGLGAVGWVLLSLCPSAFPGRCLCTSVTCGADVSVTPWLIGISGENCLYHKDDSGSLEHWIG